MLTVDSTDADKENCHTVLLSWTILNPIHKLSPFHKELQYKENQRWSLLNWSFNSSSFKNITLSKVPSLNELEMSLKYLMYHNILNHLLSILHICKRKTQSTNTKHMFQLNSTNHKVQFKISRTIVPSASYCRIWTSNKYKTWKWVWNIVWNMYENIYETHISHQPTWP